MKISTIAFFGLLALSSHSSVTGEEAYKKECATDGKSENGVLDEIFNDRRDLVNWIRESGGYVDPRQLVRQAYPDDPSSGCGVFAEEQIEAGELLLSVPKRIIVKGEYEDDSTVHLEVDSADEDEHEVDLIVDSEVDAEDEDEREVDLIVDKDVDSEDEDDEIDNDSEDDIVYAYDDSDSSDDEDVTGSSFCALMKTLTRELVLGDESHHGPYIRYMNLQPIGQIPEFWSEGGKHFLATVTGKNLRPYGYIDDKRTDYIKECGYPVNDVTVRAAMLITTRADDDTMTPYYEIYNHRNGKWHNTILEWHPSSYNVYAKKTIKKGDEIFNSYNMCTVCGGRKFSFEYGTSEVLNDYGFVESYPRRWILSDDIRFDLDEVDDGSGNLELTWDPRRRQPSAQLIKRVLVPELERLEEISHTKDDIIEMYPGIVESEIETVLIYRNGLIAAMRHALQYYE